ncbi:MAG: STAS domain-containing protein [Pseudomonadota bacterium]
MDIEVSKQGKWTVVSVGGRLDTTSAPEFDLRVKDLIAQGECFLALDFRKLDYISSAGLRSVVVAGKTAKGKGGDAACCEPIGVVKKVFEISGLGSIVPLFDSVDDAVGRP